MTAEQIAWALAREHGMTLNRCSRASRSFWAARGKILAAVMRECGQ